jgi:hypothetical protein
MPDCCYVAPLQHPVTCVQQPSRKEPVAAVDVAASRRAEGMTPRRASNRLFGVQPAGPCCLCCFCACPYLWAAWAAAAPAPAAAARPPAGLAACAPCRCPAVRPRAACSGSAPDVSREVLALGAPPGRPPRFRRRNHPLSTLARRAFPVVQPRGVRVLPPAHLRRDAERAVRPNRHEARHDLLPRLPAPAAPPGPPACTLRASTAR